MPRTIAERADTLVPLAEVFREHGYDGASIALLTQATGLGKGSLYHFFPGGKDEMLAAVLAEIDRWFEGHVYAPLRASEEPAAAIGTMFDAVNTYFRSGRRACLMGVLAISGVRDRYASAISDYFMRWIEALDMTLRSCGRDDRTARVDAEHIVLGIQGAIILAKALDDSTIFDRALLKIRASLA